MLKFENIRFHGTFRDYQQRVLDNADVYLKDGKINIVAAPGSGKTVLGLELIRRIGEPCIILSPTTAIREQWGSRFKDMFLEDKNAFSELFSADLHNVRLVNSITYQALYTAMNKTPLTDDGEDETDLSDIDLLKTIKDHGIKTVCLDEAHHLKNEWQKALEKFIGLLEKDIKIISLTATPPYDSETSEWNRYTDICGEIDEEIFVPELVARDTLCPHQDFVYFNFPSENEIRSFKEQKENAALAVQEIGTLECIRDLCRRINSEKDNEKLFSAVKEHIALFILFSHYGFELNKRIVKTLTARNGLPAFKMKYAETAIQFLLNSDLLNDEQKEEIRGVLKKHSVYEKRKVCLVLNEKLKRTLVSSVGKLESIRHITKSEYRSMGAGLRMLILTDYIKKENLSKIATEDSFNSVNIVSIFEMLRRDNDEMNIGVLSGTLVILPQSVDISAVKHKKQEIPDTRYCVVEFSGSTHNAVDFVGKLFEHGEIQVLVGTKSLLGEGWDSPCINALILASFVGSFVLSNQMRGRAIRIDRSNPDKTANIWHLVTVEPEYLFKDSVLESISAYASRDKDELTSYDYEVLKRRFDSFMGPNYTTGRIESGIERLTAIAPPYDKDGIDRINTQMLALSAQRDDARRKWKTELADDRFEVVVENTVPKEKRVPVFTFYNVALVILLTAVQSVIIRELLASLVLITSFTGLLILAIETVLFYVFYRIVKKMLFHINPQRSFKTLSTAVLKAMQECELISSVARVEVKEDKVWHTVSLKLRNASVHDQNVFNTAMTEMLSPIENPRYILIRKNIFRKYDYSQSYACPSVLGKKKEYVEVLAEKLRGSTGNFEPVYTHREDGRRFILKCRKRAYITHNQRRMNKKYKVSHWE